MVTIIMIVTYIWNSIANIERMRVLQILDTFEIEANLSNI